jgi:hypothetical protein
MRCKQTSVYKDDLRKDFISKRKCFDKVLRKTEREYNKNVIDNIELVCTDNPRQFWRYLKNLGSRPKPSIVYDDSGSVVYELSAVLDKWKNEFCCLLNRPDSNLFDNEFFDLCQREKSQILNESENNDNTTLNHEFSTGEFKKAIKRLKNNKSTSFDCIPNEILKNENIFEHLHYFVNRVFELGIIPSDWKKALISPIPKCPSKDPKIPLNNRGINLLSCVGKLYSSCINLRISNFFEHEQVYNDEQNGFREKRSCEDHIFVLSTIIGNRMLQGQSTFCAFIDEKNAFDWVDRDLLFYVLIKNGIRGKMFESIMALYENTQAAVKLNSNITEWFNISSGVRQGDPLSPTLFCVFINSLIKEINELQLGIKIGNTQVAILAFADDIVLIANGEIELNQMLAKTENWCNRYRLEVNTDKTKVVHFRPKRVKRSNYN